MKVRVPTLAPLLRSDTQGRMLAALYLHPERELTVTSLADEAQVSAPTISRDVDRLVDAGFLTQRRSGRNRYVMVNRVHALFRPMKEILQYSYGPLAVLPDILRDIDGVEEAYIFGSWAARFQGQEGPDPRDIDVLVIGDVDRMTVYEAAAAATERIGKETNIHAVTPGQWELAEDLFVQTVQARSHVAIRLGDREDGS